MFLFSFDMAVSVGRLMVKSKRESSFASDWKELEWWHQTEPAGKLAGIRL